MKRMFSLCITLLLLLTVAILGTPIVAAQDQNVQPSSGPAGTTFTFNLNGFDDGERVAYWLNTPNNTILAIGDKGASASGGQVTANWTAHAGIPLGFWQFVAHGVTSGVEKVITFEVTAGGNMPAPQSSSVVPAIGASGSTFTFTAGGFTADERIGYWLNPPTGAAVVVDDTKHHANSDGQFNLSWVAPSTATPGTWQLVAQGTQSGVLTTISFEIR